MRRMDYAVVQIANRSPTDELGARMCAICKKGPCRQVAFPAKVVTLAFGFASEQAFAYADPRRASWRWLVQHEQQCIHIS